MIAESRKKSRTEGFGLDLYFLLLQAAITSILLEMCQDLGISAQILLEGLPELSLIMALKEEKSKYENC